MNERTSRARARARGLAALRAQGARESAGLPPQMLKGLQARKDHRGPILATVLVAVLAIVTLAAFAFVAAGAASTAAAVSYTIDEYQNLKATLPDASRISADTFQTTRIFDRDGNLLQEVPDYDYGWRTFVPIEKISPLLINATIAAEVDRNDAKERDRFEALVGPVGRVLGGSGQSGGSTITQQLVRALHPEDIGNAPTVSRKFREILAAVALEQQFSKHDILSMYLNQIFYGNRSYGIEAAAETYFHKRANELTLGEATLLAGIPQRPTDYNPSLNPELAKRRQTYVLDQMVKLGYVSRAEADAAYLEMPQIFPMRDGNGAVLDHPHFVQYVYEYLAETYPNEDFSKGGLNIYTTIDTDLQNRAEEIVAANMEVLQQYNAFNAAMTVIFPPTGEVLAMVGSADFDNLSIEGKVNIATSPQQPGSAIKPIIYAAAFEQGWTPGTVVLDAPFKVETPNAIDPITQLPMPFYEPQNYNRTFNGAVTVRASLANSLNIPAVKAASYIGGAVPAVEIARRLGMKHALDQNPDDYGLSIALGSGDIWPLELNNAYATFSNMGKYVPATPILRITDTEGRIMYELDRAHALLDAEQVLRPEIAYQIISILTDNNARGMIFGLNNTFGNTQAELGRPTAAKSGTTNDFRDIWTMGFTSAVSVGVWVGNTRNAPLAEIDGIQGAGPIWSQMIREISTDPRFADLIADPATGRPIPGEFPRPPGIVEGVVCMATGGKPIDKWNGNRRELLIADGAPANRCDQLSPWQQADLAKVMKNMPKGGAFVGGAVDSIYNFARAVRFQESSQTPVFPAPDPPEIFGPN
ncbi:MAG: transglycosylase domain-containing protein [Chloroflexota bacterium]